VQQNLCGANRIGQQIQELLCLLIDPVQVLENHHQRLIEGLAQQDPLDRLQCAPLLHLTVHLCQRIITFDQTQQSEQIRQRILQRAVERDNTAGDLASEKIFEADVRGAIVYALYSASGEPPTGQSWRFAIDPKDAASMSLSLAPKNPSFVTEADIDLFVGEFTRTGFAGGLNYYRNVDRNWALTPFLDGAKLRQPTLFIAGERDGVLGFWGEYVDAMEINVPKLVRKAILPGVGHWTQQERPEEVNRLLLEFLRGLT